MPVKIPDDLPAASILDSENIFVMSEKRADTQDIRPLDILILNLMPTKVETETQLLRCLSNSPSRPTWSSFRPPRIPRRTPPPST